MVANGSLEPLVESDLYLVNMFGSAEWPRIRQAQRTHSPEASVWTEWQHQSDSVTSLYTGATFATNCGAEQGDVLGTTQRSWVPSRPRGSAMNGSLTTGKSSSDPGLLTHDFGPWTSTSTLLVPPEASWRMATSRALPVSSVRPSACRSLWEWDTSHVHDTVKVLSPDSGTTALRSAFGSREHTRESVRA